MSLRRALAITLSILLLGGGAITAKAQALDSEHAALIVQQNELVSTLTKTTARTDDIRTLIAGQEQVQDELGAVLAVRPDFIAALAKLGAVFKAADGRVDTTAPHSAAIATQSTVLAERHDPTVITNATATIDALTAKVNDEIATWEAAQRRAQTAGPSGPRWSSSGPGGYARVRAALDRVGGGGIGLYESSSCAGGSAPACANSNGYIKYRADVAGWSGSRLNWAMAHELGHIYQFRVWGALNSSSAYHSLFGGDPEYLANCMALVRGYPGSVGCNGEQQVWASGIWVGSVR